MKKGIVLFVALLAPLLAVPVLAAQLRVFVSDMNAIGGQNRDELKVTLQTLLASRLNSDNIISVGSTAEADAVVSGTYVTVGKIFSVDAVAKATNGRTLTRAFVQGDNQDELIPAIGKLAEKLTAELNKIYFGVKTTSSGSVAAPPQPAAPALPVPPVTAPPSTAKSDFIKPELRQAPAAEFIKPADYEKNTNGGWLSKRLPGAANLLALGRTLPDGAREVFLAEERRVSYYRQGADMKLVDEAEFRNSEKIISLDTVETADGALELYITTMRGDELSSQVRQVKGDKLVLLADNLPWFFRSFSLAGGPKKLYAQAMGRDIDYFGDVAEATRSGNMITLKNPIKMPRFGDIYSFNQFRDSDGKINTVAINQEGYLVVYDQDLKELWRSNDKFGGSELYFQKEDLDNVRVTGDKFRWVFMNQRIQVTSKGEILVGKNDGFWVLGNARSYKRGTVYCLTWNGSSLEEKWRTRDTQNYMPDYLYDEPRNELLILQTVQRSGISTRGASSLTIKKVE